jgi:hypothetical protein
VCVCVCVIPNAGIDAREGVQHTCDRHLMAPWQASTTIIVFIFRAFKVLLLAEKMHIWPRAFGILFNLISQAQILSIDPTLLLITQKKIK